MTDAYDDIINLPHHVSATRPRMSASDRAVQFAPFAALTGHDEAVKETARLTEQRPELDEYVQDALNEQLKMISERLEDHPEIIITYFQPDTKKDGGSYVTTSGTVKKIDAYAGLLMMTAGHIIPLAEIISIEGKLFTASGHE